jgi:beta-lactamase class C
MDWQKDSEMQRRNIRNAVIVVSFVAALVPIASRAADLTMIDLSLAVGQAIRPAMEQYDIPGMAVGVVAPGLAVVINRGVASRTTGQPVTDATLFEIGSVSKTLTATLASYALVTGKLSLTDRPSTYFPALRGSSFDKLTVLNLATHTPGGLPLQVPDAITSEAQLTGYFQNWKPTHPPGTYRTYSNLGVGMLGLIAAQSLNGNFVTVMQGNVFTGLGLQHTWLEVPAAQKDNYAQGYSTTSQPIRMTPGVLAAETYGIRTTAADMLRFVEANMKMLDIDDKLQRAITETHTGFYRLGGMTQDLVWEQYNYPVGLKTLLEGNADKVALQPNPVTAVVPPTPPHDDVLINKTGSTNGFATYVAFVPEKKLGVVLLANKNYPIAARVRAAYEILTRLDGTAAKH